MADIVNLNKIRKAKAKSETQRVAKENRAKYGRTGVEKQVVQRLESKADRALDAHRRQKAKPTAPDK